MKITGTEIRTLEAEQARRTTEQRRDTQVRDAAQRQASKTERDKAVQDDLRQAADVKRDRQEAETEKAVARRKQAEQGQKEYKPLSEARSLHPYLAGNYKDYTVESDHELVIKERERYTGKQVDQQPSKQELAFKRAFRQVVDKIFDTKA